MSLQTARPLFPEDERDLGPEMQWEFSVLKENLRFLGLRQVFETDTTVRWKLFADNMTPKTGRFLITIFSISRLVASSYTKAMDWSTILQVLRDALTLVGAGNWSMRAIAK